jgi:hypothetical protein
VERYVGWSSEVVLGQACEVLDSAEHLFYGYAFSVDSSELLRAVALEFPVDSKGTSDAFCWFLGYEMTDPPCLRATSRRRWKLSVDLLPTS